MTRSNGLQEENTEKKADTECVLFVVEPEPLQWPHSPPKKKVKYNGLLSQNEQLNLKLNSHCMRHFST